jgi:hypothetical protein
MQQHEINPLPNNPPMERKIMQRVVRTVLESPFVHFYLVCGHMITLHPENPTEKPDSSIECWACEASKKEFPSK